jgi:HME family heavy-metal exporter
MLNAVIRFALHNRLLIVVLSLAVLLYGSYVTATLPIDVFPDLDRPRVVVLTECPGLAPQDVETLVTARLEEALLGATGVEAVRSKSDISLSTVEVEFGWNMSIYRARQVVQERLATVANQLPEDVRPQLGPISSLLGQILLIGISRKPGPRGGNLAAVEGTPYLAELVADVPARTLTVFLWKYRPGEDEPWQPAKSSQREMVLTSLDDKEHIRLPASEEGETDTYRGNKLPDSAFADRDLTGNVLLDGKIYPFTFLGSASQVMDLRTTADWVIRPRILKIAGVSQVLVMGGSRKQYQVLADPAKMQQYGVSLEQIEQALKKNNVNTSGGYAERGSQEQPIRVLGRLGPHTAQVLADLRQIPVKYTPKQTVLLEQVAEVTQGAQLKRGESGVNGNPGVLLNVSRQPHTDTREVTTKVLQALDGIKASLPPSYDINPDFFQMKRFIDRGVYNVAESLAIGAFLVLLVLFLFLLNFRTTFISLTAIPLSLAITALSFAWIGRMSGVPLSINVITLGGIAVALGELVDDAIVDVENIFRRLRENNASPNPRPFLTVIYEASIEIRSAIVFGTMMVILVFLPLFALSGMEGRLFTPLGIAYIVSILASLLVSLTVTPVLSSYLLYRAQATHSTKESPLLRCLKWLASYLFRFSMARPGWILLGGWLTVVVAAWGVARLGTRFLPEFDEGSIQLNVVLPAGASLEASNRADAVVAARLKAHLRTPEWPGGLILGFLRRTGRAELEETADPVNNNEYVLAINPDSGLDREQAIKKIFDEIKESMPGVDVETEQPLSHLISHMLSGINAQVAVKIYGDDLDKLWRTAQQVKRALADVPGLKPPVPEAIRQIGELHLKPRRADLAQYGVDVQYLADALETALYGHKVSQVIEGQRRFDLVVRLRDEQRTDYTNLASLKIDLPGGRGTVPLGALADIDEYGQGPNRVKRENGRRYLAVKCNAFGRDRGSVVADIEQRIRDRVTLPAGYFIEYGGQFESQRRATLVIGALSVLSVVGMFLVLYFLYPSARIILQILNALPMAFVGGVAALWLTRQDLSVAALVGFISLGGIAARNGILSGDALFPPDEGGGGAFQQGDDPTRQPGTAGAGVNDGVDGVAGAGAAGGGRQRAGARDPVPGGDGDSGGIDHLNTV